MHVRTYISGFEINACPHAPGTQHFSPHAKSEEMPVIPTRTGRLAGNHRASVTYSLALSCFQPNDRAPTGRSMLAVRQCCKQLNAVPFGEHYIEMQSVSIPDQRFGMGLLFHVVQLVDLVSASLLVPV